MEDSSDWFNDPMIMLRNWVPVSGPSSAKGDGVMWCGLYTSLLTGTRSCFLNLSDGAPIVARLIPFQLYGPVFFKTYDTMKKNLKANNCPTPLVGPVGAVVADIAASGCSTPLQVFMAVASTRKGGPLTVSKYILTNFGLKGFYKGQLTRFLGDLPTTAIMFGLFEFMKARWYPPENPRTRFRCYNAAVLGFLSGAIAGIITAPLAASDPYIFEHVIKRHLSPADEWRGFVENLKSTSYFHVHTGMRMWTVACFGGVFLGAYQFFIPTPTPVQFPKDQPDWK